VITGTGPTPPEECPSAAAPTRASRVDNQARNTASRDALLRVGDVCSTSHKTPKQPSPPQPNPPQPGPPPPGQTIPDTGGPAGSLLWGGIALVALGGGLMLVARRRRTGI